MPFFCDVEMDIAPPSGIASRELDKRLMKTCSSFPGSPMMSGTVAKSSGYGNFMQFKPHEGQRSIDHRIDVQERNSVSF